MWTSKPMTKARAERDLEAAERGGGPPRSTMDTLTITDNRTGRQYEIPIKEGAIRATDLKQIHCCTRTAGRKRVE